MQVFVVLLYNNYYIYILFFSIHFTISLIYSYSISATNLEMYIPTEHGNAVDDISMLDQYNHLKLFISSFFAEISDFQHQYNSDGCYGITLMMGDFDKTSSEFPIVMSFKPHQRHPVGQLRNGVREDHYTDFLGCEALLLKGDYHYHPVIADVSIEYTLHSVYYNQCD